MTRTELLQKASAIYAALGQLPDTMALIRAAEAIEDQESTAAAVAWAIAAGAEAAHQHLQDEASRVLAEADELRDPIGVD